MVLSYNIKEKSATVDIRRLVLWEGRYATYMSNDIFAATIEDQGDVLLELTSRALSGARINALALPYFRSTGESVESDPNAAWWQNMQSLYQAGGGYFSFLTDSALSTDAYWILRRYGTEDEFGGVWRYSEMKVRGDNGYRIGKIDMILPGQPVLYTAIRVENRGTAELRASVAWHSMLGYPAIETGTMIQTDARYFTAYGMTQRESGVGRFRAGVVFEELKHAPLARGGSADAGYMPSPSGTYDYIIGKIPERDERAWIAVNNPRSQLLFFMLTPGKAMSDDDYVFPNMDLAENFLGRMDSPWALYDGGTPQIMALTCGFNAGPKGTRNMVLSPGEAKTMYVANAFASYDNPRIGLGYYATEFTEDGVVFKRTKSWAMIPVDHRFRAIRRQAEKVFTEAEIN